MENQEKLVMAIIIGCTAMFGLIVVFILFVAIYQRKMIEKENKIQLFEQEKQIQLFKASTEAEEEQKKKIAHNLHDEINPLLTILKFNLSKHHIAIKKGMLTPDNFIEDGKMLDKAIEGIRTICYDLIPSFFMEYGLIPSLESYVKNIKSTDNIYGDFTSNVIPEEVESFSQQEQLNIYRVCLEILNNLFKHSGCSSFKLSIFSKNQNLIVEITHNGKGVSNEEMILFTDNSKGLGLKSLKARLILLKANINYQKDINTPSITLTIPINSNNLL